MAERYRRSRAKGWCISPRLTANRRPISTSSQPVACLAAALTRCRGLSRRRWPPASALRRSSATRSRTSASTITGCWYSVSSFHKTSFHKTSCHQASSHKSPCQAPSPPSSRAARAHRPGARSLSARCRVVCVSDAFFERPAPVKDPGPPAPSPPWTGPPHGMLPGVAALELVLASNNRAAVYIARCAAYPTGFELEVRVVVPVGTDELDPSLNGVYHRPGRGSTYEEMLRFGIAFSDGRKATNVGGPGPGHGPGEPTGPVLRGMGGSGGGGRWRQDFWVWPLPPPGPVGFVCEWPAAGIPLSRHEIDAQILLDAAARARGLFPDEPTSHLGGTWSS